MPESRRNEPLIMALTAIGQVHSSDGVLQGLRRTLMDGSVAAGSIIPVGDVAKAFGVSAIPVREALKTLVSEGLVGHETNGGYFVAQLTLAELREVFYIRGVLEDAAMARVVDNITDDELEALQAAHEALIDSNDESIARSYHELTRTFHTALLSPCRMPRLMAMIESTWNITEPARATNVASPEMLQLLADDHAEVIAALRARDSTTARAIGHRHHARLDNFVFSSVQHLNPNDKI